MTASLAPHQFPLQIVKRARAPFDGEQWLFEIKHDGFRVMAVRDVGQTRLFTRNGYDITRTHAHIIDALNALPATRFVIDGELVVLDDDGRSNFARLMFGRKGTHVFAFDLLAVGETDLRPHALEVRKSVLQGLLGHCNLVRYCDHVLGSGKAFFELVREAGLEGMVAKRRRSSYRGDLTGDWLKIKCLRTHDFVVGGWIPHRSDSSRIGALLLGEFFDDALHYVGRVDSGFDQKTIREIANALTARSDSPFREPIPEKKARFASRFCACPSSSPISTYDGLLRPHSDPSAQALVISGLAALAASATRRPPSA